MADVTIKNARLVLSDRIVWGGVVIDGSHFCRILSLEEAEKLQNALNFEGDFLLPGFVDLDTENLALSMGPRPCLRGPSHSTAFSHDARLATSGVTTAFNCMSLSAFGFEDTLVRIEQSIAPLQSSPYARCRHRLHLRCDVSFSHLRILLRHMAFHPLIGLISLTEQPAYGETLRGPVRNVAGEGSCDFGSEHDDSSGGAPPDPNSIQGLNRDAVIGLADRRGLGLAIRNASSADMIEESRIGGVSIVAFPRTIEAAIAARHSSMKIIGRAPEIVCREQTEGRTTAFELATLGLIDILTSDYSPSSLLQSAFALAAILEGGLAEAVRLISSNPAKAVGLSDCGEIAEGKRADLVRVGLFDKTPIVRETWRDGRRIA